MRAYFDLETTGLDPQTRVIAQIGAVAEDGREFEVKARFAPRDADAAALALGWYDEAAWRQHAVPLGEALDRFAAWLAGLGGRTHLAGHFAAEFDKPFLLAACKREGRRFPADYRVLDTMQLALWLLPGRRSYKLPDLYRDLCGGELSKKEGALGDARATRALVAALRARFVASGVPAAPATEAAVADDDHDPLVTAAIHMPDTAAAPAEKEPAP